MTDLEPSRRVLVTVDDDLMARAGVRVHALEIDPTLQVEDLTFSEALERTDWQAVDFVIVDLSQPVPHDQRADEYPGVGVIRHVAVHTGVRRPHLIAITGEYSAFTDEVIMRRVAEAGAAHFMYRSDFAAQLHAILDPAAYRSMPTLQERPMAASPVHGIGTRTRLNSALDAIRNSEVLDRHITGGTGNKRRAVIGEAYNVHGVNPEGERTTKSPSTRQLRGLYGRATRIYRRGTQDDV